MHQSAKYKFSVQSHVLGVPPVTSHCHTDTQISDPLFYYSYPQPPRHPLTTHLPFLTSLLKSPAPQQPSLQQIGSLGRIQQCAYQKQVVKLILIIGAGCLCFSQILLATLGGCVCCVTLQYSRGTAHRWSMVLFGLSWYFTSPSYRNFWERNFFSEVLGEWGFS